MSHGVGTKPKLWYQKIQYLAKIFEVLFPAPSKMVEVPTQKYVEPQSNHLLMMKYSVVQIIVQIEDMHEQLMWNTNYGVSFRMHERRGTNSHFNYLIKICKAQIRVYT